MKQLARSHPKQGEIELDLGRYELRRGGRRIKLEKKPMELLIFLVQRREQLVSREEIQARLWHTDLFIDTERNINNIVRKIRRAVGDDSAKQRFLETVVGKGYRFVGSIRVISPLYGNSDPAANADGKMPIRGDVAWGLDRSSLAVLPLFFSETASSGMSRMITASAWALPTPSFHSWQILKELMSCQHLRF